MIVNFKTQKGRFAFVKISDPWNLKDILAISMGIEQELLFVNKNYHPSQIKEIGFVKKLTEEQWEEVVDEVQDIPNGYINAVICYYNYIDKHYDYLIASHSGKSLMESLSLDNGNWLLIKYDN